MTEHAGRILSAIRNVPAFRDIDAEGCTIRRLGGMTNLVHRVTTPRGDVIVRIPGEGTEEYIDRSVEIANAEAAHRAGVSPEVLWADKATGVMITRYIGGIATMTPELFRTRAGSPARAGRVLARLHRSGETFAFHFQLFSMIDSYLKVLSTKQSALPDGYHAVVGEAEPVKDALAAHPLPMVPCHCDPLCENFLDDGDAMWIVDWEYSGMNDPLWDVGDVSVEAGMDPDQEAELLRAYFGRTPSAAEVGRVVVYKAMCDLLWTLWGLIQHADGNPAEDFWAYATTRFERCKALMQSDAFPRHVAAVRAG